MTTYSSIRHKYRPDHVRVLIIAESPPPYADIESSRHFYRTDKARKNDRLFVNTVKALYSQASGMTEAELEERKESWLKQFQKDGFYMIEALEKSQPHEVTKRERQELIRRELPQLIERVNHLANKDTGIMLVKSNVFEVAARPLSQAGFKVLNKQLVDYPGQFNQKAYQDKLARLVKQVL